MINECAGNIWTGKEVKEFIAMVSPEFLKQATKHKISLKVVFLACEFMRIKFDQNDLKDSIEVEVSRALELSMIYYVNVANESID